MRTKLQKIIIFLSLLFVVIDVSSQTIAVKSFRKLETDQEARIASPKIDQNGKKCAIIKVVTTQTGFVFDFGMIGNAIATEQKTGELWVWVPAGARKLTINHQQLGVLRNYEFKMDIKEATVYEMILTSAKVETTVKEEQIAAQWLVINSTPIGADIYIDDIPSNQTPYQNELPLGKHTYRISRDMYLPTAGNVVLTADNKENLNLVLKPDFGTLTITTDPETGATVSIDGQSTGQITPCTLEQVKSGEHTVTLRLNMYKTSSEKINMHAGGDIKLPITLTPTFAEVTINTIPSSNIYIAGESKGEGTWSGRLIPGIYLFEAKLNKYNSDTEKLEVITGQPINLTLQPIAQTGILKIMTTPADAKITIDDKGYGTTPNTINKLLVGDYTLKMSKIGYASVTKTITISENKLSEINVALKERTSFRITSNPTGANIQIDGKHVGTTPFEIQDIENGDHSFLLLKDGRSASQTISISDDGKRAFDFYLPEVPKVKKIKTFKPNKPAIRYLGFNATLPLIENYNSNYYDFDNYKFAYEFMAGIVKTMGVYGKITYNGKQEKMDNIISNLSKDYYYKSNPYFVSSFSRMGAVGGIMFHAKPIVLYAGGGYGYYNNYSKVDLFNYSDDQFIKSINLGDNNSIEGIETNAGIIFKLGKIGISVGGTSIEFKYYEINLGIGLFF